MKNKLLFLIPILCIALLSMPICYHVVKDELAEGGLITKPHTFAPNTTILSSQVNSDFDTIYNDYNGGINNDNIASLAGIIYGKLNLANSIKNADVFSDAAIADTKLATITTAGKVNSSALTGTNWTDLTDGGATTLHSHAIGSGIEIFTSSGTFTAPAGITKVYLTMVGGGGGGGSGAGGSGLGGGGGGGGAMKFNFAHTVTPSSTYTVTIGAGGAGGTIPASSGASGGTTSLDTVSVGGGSPGMEGSAGSSGGVGMNGSASTGGGQTLQGGNGAVTADGTGGGGGGSLFGSGGGGGTSGFGEPGGNGTGYGGGGGGGDDFDGLGGAGSGGIVIVMY